MFRNVLVACGQFLYNLQKASCQTIIISMHLLVKRKLHVHLKINFSSYVLLFSRYYVN